MKHKTPKKCIYYERGYCLYPKNASIFEYRTKWDEAKCEDVCEDYKETFLKNSKEDKK